MKYALAIYVALFIVMTTACQKSNQEATSAGANSICITQPSACNSSLYQQSNGYTAYNNSSNPFYYVNNSAYLCNCPYGYIPTYNSYSGLGCVRTAYFDASFYSGFYGYLYLGWASAQWYIQPQLYTYSYSNLYCYSGAIQSCVVNQSSNSCPAGSVCRQNSSDSSLGLCVTAYR